MWGFYLFIVFRSPRDSSRIGGRRHPIRSGASPPLAKTSVRIKINADTRYPRSDRVLRVCVCVCVGACVSNSKAPKQNRYRTQTYVDWGGSLINYISNFHQRRATNGAHFGLRPLETARRAHSIAEQCEVYFIRLQRFVIL